MAKGVTDIYRVIDGGLKHVDRMYHETPTIYHRLIDAMTSETLGMTERALQEYAQAAETAYSAYEGYLFVNHEKEVIEDGQHESFERKFHDTMLGFARLRGSLLQGVEEGKTRSDACREAKRRWGYDSSWLTYLNAPFGYANPLWSDDKVCGPLSVN